MGVQPRAFSVPSDQQGSPSTSPASRKRRFMDVVLLKDDEQQQLTQRVTFKRSKSGEAELHVQVRAASPSRDSESLEPVTPTGRMSDVDDKTSPSAKNTARPNMSASQTITLDMLRPHFEKPLAQVAQVFGICVTLLKKICRKNGLARWPHRQIIGLRKSIASMEQAIGHFEGARRESYAQQLEKQRNKLTALLEDPTKCNLLAVDDEYLPPHPAQVEAVRAPAASHMPSHAPYYAGYAPVAAPVYDRSYASYPEYYQAAPAMPPHHPVSYAPQHYYPPTQPAYTHHAAHVAQPPTSVMLPPLRMDTRPALPSLSSVVGRRW